MNIINVNKEEDCNENKNVNNNNFIGMEIDLGSEEIFAVYVIK